MNKAIEFLLILLALAVAGGCQTIPNVRDASRNTNWHKGCVTPDESSLGIIGDETVLIDLATGKITRRIDKRLKYILCFPDNSVVAVSDYRAVPDAEAVWLTEEKTVLAGIRADSARAVSESDVMLTDRRPSSCSDLSRRTIDCRDSRWIEPLEISIVNLEQKAQVGKTFVFYPKLFPEIGVPSAANLETEIVKVLDQNRLLLLVGPSWTATVENRRWGFYTYDRRDDKVVLLDSLQTDDNPIKSVLSAYASADEQVFAVSRSEETVAVKRKDQAAVFFDLKAKEVRLNPDGSLLAVSKEEIKDIPGTQQHEFVWTLSVFDVATKQSLWQMQTEGAPRVFEFLGDDSLVIATAARVVSRKNGRSGQAIW